MVTMQKHDDTSIKMTIEQSPITRMYKITQLYEQRRLLLNEVANLEQKIKDAAALGVADAQQIVNSGGL